MVQEIRGDRLLDKPRYRYQDGRHLGSADIFSNCGMNPDFLPDNRIAAQKGKIGMIWIE